MSDTFQIDTPGVDVKKVVEEIRARVDQKRAGGVYQRYNLSSLRAVEVDSNANDDAHCDFYLRNIWAAANVDLGDFPILAKSRFLGEPAVWLKKIIWKLLKFYTYRLFSQQKDFNLKMAAIASGLNRKFEHKISALEGRIETLQKK